MEREKRKEGLYKIERDRVRDVCKQARQRQRSKD